VVYVATVPNLPSRCLNLWYSIWNADLWCTWRKA